MNIDSFPIIDKCLSQVLILSPSLILYTDTCHQ